MLLPNLCETRLRLVMKHLVLTSLLVKYYNFYFDVIYFLMYTLSPVEELSVGLLLDTLTLPPLFMAFQEAFASKIMLIPKIHSVISWLLFWNCIIQHIDVRIFRMFIFFPVAGEPCSVWFTIYMRLLSVCICRVKGGEMKWKEQWNADVFDEWFLKRLPYYKALFWKLLRWKWIWQKFCSQSLFGTKPFFA